MTKIKIKWRWILLISIVFILFVCFIFPQMNKYSNDKISQSKLPDTLLIYPGADLYHMAESYGESGRLAYIKLIWTFDLVWPFIYISFLLLWTIKLLEYLASRKNLRYIFIFQILTMFFDFMENIGFTIVMVKYPLMSEMILSITPLMTSLKWISLLVSALMLIYLIVAIILSKIKR